MSNSENRILDHPPDPKVPYVPPVPPEDLPIPLPKETAEKLDLLTIKGQEDLVSSLSSMVIFGGIDSILNMNIYPLRTGLSGITSYISRKIGWPISVKFFNTSPSLYDMDKYAISPAISGALYAASSEVLRLDNRSLLYKFLLSYGSSAAGNYSAPYIRKYYDDYRKKI